MIIAFIGNNGTGKIMIAKEMEKRLWGAPQTEQINMTKEERKENERGNEMVFIYNFTSRFYKDISKTYKKDKRDDNRIHRQ